MTATGPAEVYLFTPSPRTLSPTFFGQRHRHHSYHGPCSRPQAHTPPSSASPHPHPDLARQTTHSVSFPSARLPTSSSLQDTHHLSHPLRPLSSSLSLQVTPHSLDLARTPAVPSEPKGLLLLSAPPAPAAPAAPPSSSSSHSPTTPLLSSRRRSGPYEAATPSSTISVAMPPTAHPRPAHATSSSSYTWEPYPPTKPPTTADRPTHRLCQLGTAYSSLCLSSIRPVSTPASMPVSTPASMPVSMPVSMPISAPTLHAHSHHNSPCDPSLSSMDLKELSSDAVSKMLEHALTPGGDRHTVLLLDMRPTMCHSVSSIKTAISITVPNILLKRPVYSLGMVTEHLASEQEAEQFSDWRQFHNIVFFDATGATPVKGTTTFSLAQKFRREGYMARIGFVHGGFNAFVHDHASLCSREGEVSLDNGPEGTQPYQIGSYAANSGHGAGHTDNARRSCPSKPVVANTATTTKSAGAARAPLRCRLHLGSLPGSTLLQSRAANGLVASGSRGCSNNNNNTSSPICQTPMLENPNVNPLFESVRQSMGLNSNITEEISVRYPAGMNAEKVKQVSGRLPQWLSQAVQELHGKTMLANLFQKIEKSEKKRLALLMLPEAMRVGQPVTHSLCAGLEKGLKNRYSNVWPFDQTRIKLQTSARKDKDDYINASLLRPSSISKSYIATQAPLPSTIPDFWQMVDEQESSVIVMLTREQEMGRIKCHQYWPTALEPVLDFGRQKVEFVREWQPNPAMDTVLVRQLRLYSIQEENMEAKSKPEGRLITQIQYTGWPDLGVPETPLQVLEVIRLANEHNKSKTTSKQAGPMVVHCSAGCGRTGAFCVIDTILSEFHEQLEAIQGREEAVPPKNGEQVEQAREKDLVFALVDTIRDQRLSMVQTLRQYVFCYEAILWHLMISHLKIEGVTGLSGLDRLASLNDTSRQGAGSSCGSVDASRKTSADNEFSFFG